MKTAILLSQIGCIVMVGVGIFIEAKYQAHLGFIFITAGSLAFALSEKLDKFRIKRDIRDNTNSHKNRKNE